MYDIKSRQLYKHRHELIHTHNPFNFHKPHQNNGPNTFSHCLQLKDSCHVFISSLQLFHTVAVMLFHVRFMPPLPLADQPDDPALTVSLPFPTGVAAR